MIRIDSIETDKDGRVNLAYTEGDPLPKAPSGAGYTFNTEAQYNDWISRNAPQTTIPAKVAGAVVENRSKGATDKDIEGKEYAVGAVEIPVALDASPEIKP